jgi:glycine dehydrogenase subunit 1
MNYIPHTDPEIKQMLKTIGVSSVDALFSEIDKSFFSKRFSLPEGRSEFELFEYLKKTAAKNDTSLINLSGGGFYDHYIPAVVDKLAGRAEFYTPYTPYQPECSQGTLQAIYEYQTLICRLTKMEAANASVYDGATALAEGILMAVRITKRKKIIIDAALNPIYQKIIKTYLNSDCYQIITVDSSGYGINRSKILKLLDSDTAVVVFQNPNFFGKIDNYSDLVKAAHKKQILTILSTYPVALGLLKSPGSIDCDIVTGEAQCLGNQLNFGGPLLGFIATRKKYVRKLPGRVVGATEDKDGRRGFVLTLQAREQHIRRNKATSNICTNQNLSAIRALIYLVSLGKDGFRELSKMNYFKAQFARKTLSQIDKLKIDLNYPIFNEFIIEIDSNVDNFYERVLDKGFIPGISLAKFYPVMKNKFLICITEKISKEDILNFKEVLETTIND